MRQGQLEEGSNLYLKAELMKFLVGFPVNPKIID
jgi:hypothetical protein